VRAAFVGAFVYHLCAACLVWRKKFGKVFDSE
jgi:hypothetical protein